MSEQEAPTTSEPERVSPDHMDAYRFAQRRLQAARMELAAAQASHDGTWLFIADRYKFLDGDALLEDGEIARVAAAKQQRKRPKASPPTEQNGHSSTEPVPAIVAGD